MSPSSIKSSSGSKSESNEELSEVQPVKSTENLIKKDQKREKPKRPKTLIPTRSPLSSPMKRSPKRKTIDTFSSSERRRRRRTGIGYETESEKSSKREARGERDEKDQQRPLSASSRDKVTLGHLDMCEDTVAQPISDEAKKLMSKASSTQRPASSTRKPKVESSKKKSKRNNGLQLPETIAELSDTQNNSGDEDESSLGEQDREISESLQTVHAMLGSPTKDAQVQTPTKRSKGGLKVRGKIKPKPKPRSFGSGATGVPQVSSESLLSTESEEIIELHHLEDSSSETTNPLGKMRRRFHQFLDDAFNVIGKVFIFNLEIMGV